MPNVPVKRGEYGHFGSERPWTWIM